MSSELANILQSNPALFQTGLDADTLAVAGGSVNSNKRISIKGGVFRKYAGGKEVGTIEDRHMNVIVVKMAHNAARTYYADNYKEGEKSSPTCWSSDSQTPDVEVKSPQAKSCDSCPLSVKNSAAGGGSACRLSWRLAVVLPDDPAGDVMQLVLPATSAFAREDNGKWGFRPYVQMLASNNVSASRVVSKMQFDTKSPTPKVLWSPAAGLSQELFEIIDRQGKSKAAEQAVKLTVFQAEGEAPAVAQPVIVDTTVASTKSDVVADAEPILRESAPSSNPDKVNNVNDIVKKWAKT
jgi:hypothetical protein